MSKLSLAGEYIIYCTSHFRFECLGVTPLHVAAEEGSADVLDILCDVPSCDVNLKVMIANLFLVLIFYIVGVNVVI